MTGVQTCALPIWQCNECVRGGPIGNETVAVALLESSGVAKPGFYPEALTFSAPPSPAVDGRGRAVLVGHVNQPSLGPGRFAMRLRANGTVDTHFGDEGWAELPSGGGLGRVATDTDNRPVISGGLTLGNDGWGGFSLTRLTAKGRRDAKFGGGTTTRIFFRASEAGTPGSVMVDEEGRILVAGSLTYPGSSGAEAVGVVRYVPKG